MFIDTHVHLNDPDLYPKIDEVIQDAINNNVKCFICIGYDKASSELALKIANTYDFVYCAIGFHPTELKGITEEDYLWLDEALNNPKVVAVGEVGYDFHWDKTTKEEQEQAFIRQIKLAIKHNLPLSIHSRDALELTYQTLRDHNARIVGGVMHSYSGSYEFAENFIDINFYLGISGPVTFKNGIRMKEVVKNIDLKYLLSETDSPYLTPHPYRGTENGPKYIPLIIQEIANIKEMNIKEVENQLELNTQTLFKINL